MNKIIIFIAEKKIYILHLQVFLLRGEKNTHEMSPDARKLVIGVSEQV